jgi:hypothetical protein
MLIRRVGKTMHLCTMGEDRWLKKSIKENKMGRQETKEPINSINHEENKKEKKMQYRT